MFNLRVTSLILKQNNVLLMHHDQSSSYRQSSMIFRSLPKTSKVILWYNTSPSSRNDFEKNLVTELAAYYRSRTYKTAGNICLHIIRVIIMFGIRRPYVQTQYSETLFTMFISHLPIVLYSYFL